LDLGPGVTAPARGVAALLVAFAAAVGGCQPRPELFPLEPIPMRDALMIVNQNAARIDGTLRASGSVDGRFLLPDGRTAGYNLDGILFYLPPTYVRFDFKSFGDRKFLLGSNEEHFWYYDKEGDTYHCGRHGSGDELASQIGIPPDQIIDALGLGPIPAKTPLGDRSRCVQRIVADYQQILSLIQDVDGNTILQKEYWLDRRQPRLIRRVVFRNGDGIVEMESRLDDYQALSPDGPMLPRLMIAEWPQTGERMRFRVGKWREVPGLGPRSIQFAQPKECVDQ
jgi:hypothetical protein